MLETLFIATLIFLAILYAISYQYGTSKWDDSDMSAGITSRCRACYLLGRNHHKVVT